MQHLRDYRPSDYLIPTVELEFDLDAHSTLVTSRLNIIPNPNARGDRGPLRLDGEDLELLEIKLNGQPLSKQDYQIDNHGLTLARQDQSILLEIRCLISPEKNYRLEGLYASQSLLCTQCEAEGFRHITYFIDRPDVLCRWSVRLRGDRKKYPYLLAGGELIESWQLNDGRHETYWIDPWPKPSYLFAIAAGPLFEIHDQYTTLTGRTIDLYLYCEPHNSNRLGFALEALKRSMLWDEEYFGREYDLNRFQIVAVDSFNMGAMENKGLNIFNAQCLLAHQTTTTDDEFRRIEAIIAHEYFHNWTGNRITCRDWFQLTLKEGLTVFRDQLFSSTFHSPGVLRLEQVQNLFARQFPEDAGAMAHPIQPTSYQDINNFYTPTVYEKGAEVIRMMHTLLQEKFRAGMDCYFERHDGQAVTTEDFVKALEDGSNYNLSTMRRWYKHYRTPHVYIKRTKNPQTGNLQLQIEQKPTPCIDSASEPLCMPLKLALWDSKSGFKLCEKLMKLETWNDSWNFEAPTDALVSINRGYTSPIIIHDDHTESELLALAKIDDDPIVRWMTSQQLLKQAFEGYVSDQKIDSSGWVEFVRATLNDPHLDLHLKALLIRLPQPQEILEWQDVWNIEASVQFHDFLTHEVVHKLYDLLWQTYKNYHHPKATEFNAQNSQMRHIKHAVMEYLVWSRKPEIFEALWQQQQEAGCMSDEAGALRLLASVPNAYQIKSLELYSLRWSQDNLTWPRWFAVQSMSRGEDTLERSEKLFNHPQFNPKIPNQVRALLGGLASNARVFHSFQCLDVAMGYRWLAQKIAIIDNFNPQIAARIAKSFSMYPRLSGERREKLRCILEELCQLPKLSKSTREIIERCLKF